MSSASAKPLAMADSGASAAASSSPEREANTNANTKTNTKTNTNRNESAKRKEKTLFNWLLVKSGNANTANANANDNNNRLTRAYFAANGISSKAVENDSKKLKNHNSSKHINSNNYNSYNSNINNNNNSKHSCVFERPRAFPDSGLRDFRGVQSLRHLWNKRISASFEEEATHAHPRGPIGTLRKLNKSVSCLVNAFNNARDSAPSVPATPAGRAQSLHDCTQIEQLELQLALQLELELQLELHREKDDFYKYKNAEQAKMRAKLRAPNTAPDEAPVLNCSGQKKTASVGEHLLSQKRQDLPPISNAATSSEPHSAAAAAESTLGLSAGDAEQQLLINGVAAHQQTEPVTAANVSLPAHGSSSGCDDVSLPTNLTPSPSPSPPATTTTIATATTTGRTRRKYSFKTHAGKSYVHHHHHLHHHHHHRRLTMGQHNSSNSSASGSNGSAADGVSSGTASTAAGGGGGDSCCSGSMVAKLTQQFNEIIQKDRRLLEEVKRKNGVWMSRGSHVYKIVEKQTGTGESAVGSTVQQNIKKFEKLEKPLVPLKSHQVVRKHRESLATRPNSLPLTSRQQRHKRQSLKLQHQQQQASPKKQEQQQQTQLAMQKLEVVREEAKTPQDNEHSVEFATEAMEQLQQHQLPETPDASELREAAEPTELTEQAAIDEEQQQAERQKQRKHKYAKIYEKFRFRSPFGQSKKSPTASAASTPSKSLEELPELPANDKLCVESPEPTADAKLLDALHVLDQKLKHLSLPQTTATSMGELITSMTDEQRQEQLLLLASNDEFEQRLLPNSSFVYQAAHKQLQISNNQLLVNQAVNVTLVNTIEGEQMVMEQKELAAQQMQLPASLATPEEPMYEPIEQQAAATTPSSVLFKISGKAARPSEDIYQTVEEARTEPLGQVRESTWLEGYESIAGSHEASSPATAAAASEQRASFDGYESFASTPSPTATEATVTPVVPITPTGTGTLGRNTHDELPELPKPKRIIVANKALPVSQSPVSEPPRQPPEDHHYYADDDDENIYDTIKGAHCYESMSLSLQQTKVELVNGQVNGAVVIRDALSINSNCYESIASYRKSKQSCVQLSSSSGSTLTISSDHKTNSLYESSLAAGLHYGSASVGCRSSLGSTNGSGSGSGRSNHSGQQNGNVVVVAGTGVGNCVSGTGNLHRRSSIAASSDNSDAWVDISDGEPAEPQFMVVRERYKPHRSPDWSKRIRDKRLQEQKAQSCIDDDSDHYYETLSPLSHKRHSTQLTSLPRTPSQHHKRNQDVPRYVSNGVRNSQRQRRAQQQQQQQAATGQSIYSDDYDSFETDTDAEADAEAQKERAQPMHLLQHSRLPEPPAPQNHVYAMVRRFKDFISNKKTSKGCSKYGSQQKLYENSSQFYVDSSVSSSGNLYEKSRTLSRKKLPKKSPSPAPDDNYENGAFHKSASPLSNSEKNLLAQQQTNYVSPVAAPPVIQTLLRNKPKHAKSLRSRLRQSLVGSSFDSKHLSTLSSTRSTFYIEDPAQCGSGELDSGFSEKADSGDIPVQSPTEASPPASSARESPKFATVARKAKKDSKTTQRRRTTIGIRPHEPPPPPPEEKLPKTPNTAPATGNFWYAECGVFKQTPPALLLPGDQDERVSKRESNDDTSHSQCGSSHSNGISSWYAESGLYQTTSGNSVASSSGSSGVSTGNEGGCGVGGSLNDDLQPHSLFLNEPLYQIYSAAKLESITRDLEAHENSAGSSTDGYEEIGLQARARRESADAESVAAAAADASPELLPAECPLLNGKDSKIRKSMRPTALQLVEPKNGPSRTLWSEIPEVISSGILPKLTPRERGLQEAKFEIITSEASYLKSLNLLRSHFMNNTAFHNTGILSARDRKALFSYIVPVHECSASLLSELESCWQDNVMLAGLSQRIYAIAEQHFHVYIAFCEHQGRMDRTLRRLKESKGGVFQQQLEKLESSPNCCGLNLHSFLMLPMQRITRLPLLIDAVFSKVSPNDDDYDSWKMTLAIMNKIVTQCNEAANLCEQAYELERISKQLEFPSHIRSLAIAPVGVPKQGAKPRFLVKRGELTHLMWRGDDAKLTFGKRFTKSSIYAFLFSDLLVLSKRKGDTNFTVFDYCPRSMLTIASGDSLPQLPTKDIKDQTNKNLILMTLLENHESKTIELVLACPSVSDQQRWLQAMRPPEAETPGEKLYESWDCPQVIAKHSYESDEPDVLNLEIGDVVNVSRKLPDGWYQGERIRDGAVGWFPGSYTEEVNSAHVRARNLKQRYRLLTFTATYLESQKRK